MKSKTVDILKEGVLLPPTPDKCQKCAVAHPPEAPHDATSLYYQYWFKKQYGRWPTWEDAMAHCSEEVKKGTIEVLEENHVDWRNHEKTN
jgi:hypothetical protein